MRKIVAINIFCLLFASISFAGIVKYQGSATKGSAVAVYLYNTGTPATLFSDAIGKTHQGNPVAANNSGTYSFYIEEGQYDLYVSLAGSTTATRNVSIIAPSLTGTNTFSGLLTTSAGISPDGTNASTIPTATGTIALLSGIGSYSLASSPTVSTILTTADCGKIFYVGTDALTFTLPTAPAISAGACHVKFQNTGAAGNNIISIKSNGSAVLQGTCSSATIATIISSNTGSTLTNTKTTAKTGDFVNLYSAGSTTWVWSGCTGTWASN